jgi:RND family efflux transporter MFP subunit
MIKLLKMSVCAVAISLSLPLAAQEAKEPPPALVEVELAKSELIAEQIWVPGTVISRTDSNIASEVAGRITWMAEVGAQLEPGDVLASLDDHRLQLELEQHQASIAKWESKVNLLDRKQKRFSAMVANNSSSRDLLDEIVSDLEVSQQELAQAKIDLKLIQYQISQTQVKAPFRALVVERLQNTGEFTSVGKNMMRIVDTGNIEASIKAPLSAVPFIKQGMQVAVKDQRLETQQTIRTIVPVGNAQSRMMEVRVALQAGEFAIGSAVRVALPHSDYHQALTVPRDALVLRQTGVFIYTVDNNDQAQQVPVQTGIGVGNRIEVIGELLDNSNVVVRGAERLQAGQKVRFEVTTEVAKLQI